MADRSAIPNYLTPAKPLTRSQWRTPDRKDGNHHPALPGPSPRMRRQQQQQQPQQPNPQQTPTGERGSRPSKSSLPTESTEPIDKNRDYPPIVTADGKVDTDIDHLTDEDDEDLGDLVPQDIPSTFPRPKVIHTIEGSLDDDIDNLMNDDGTMTHTLVESPKNFCQCDLKEINSKTNGKKPNGQTQSNRSFNKMHQDRIEDDSLSAGSEIIPYSERNNSSNELDHVSNTMRQRDSCNEQGLMTPLEEIETEQFCSSPEDKLLKNEVVEKRKENSLEIENSIPQSNCCQKTILSDHIATGESNEIEEQDLENIADSLVNKVLHRNPTEENLLEPTENVRQSVKEVSKTDQLNTVPPGNEEEGPQIAKVFIVIVENDATCNPPSRDHPSEMTGPSTTTTKSMDNLTSDCEQINNSNRSKPLLNNSIALLKKALDSMSSCSQADPDSMSESQRALTVTALKVAGESMAAAAKMADRLTCLIKMASQSARQ